MQAKEIFNKDENTLFPSSICNHGQNCLDESPLPLINVEVLSYTQCLTYTNIEWGKEGDTIVTCDITNLFQFELYSRGVK